MNNKAMNNILTVIYEEGGLVSDVQCEHFHIVDNTILPFITNMNYGKPLDFDSNGIYIGINIYQFR